MPDDRHLSSLVVHARPDAVEDVRRRVEAEGCEVHLTSPEGKLVVTTEAATARALGDTLTCVQLLEGVLSAAMVFHHVDDDDDDDDHEAATDAAQDADKREAQP